MSGIVGLWNLAGRPVDLPVLQRMSATLHHRGPDGEGHRVAGAVGFAHQRSWATPEEVGEIQPLVGPDGMMLAFDGRIDNRDELRRSLRLAAGASDAAYVLAAYQQWGEQAAERLNGDFAFAVYDSARRRLVLVRDAVGVRPLYFFRSSRLFVFGSEIKALLAHPEVPLQPDNDGLADFLMFSSRPLDRQDVTCFAGISALVPAHVAVVTPEAISTRRYWDFDTGRSETLGSFDDYAEAFRERFAEAVRRRIRSARPVAVSVSGGLDSSSIMCQSEVLRRANPGTVPPLVGISYTGAQGSDADEERYLLDLEREYGIAVVRFPMEPLVGLVNGTAEQVRAIESPFLDYLWGVTRNLHLEAQRRGARVLLSGHWGDQFLFCPDYLVDLFRRFAWADIWRHLREYRHWLGGSHARALARRFVRDLARRHVPDLFVPPLKWVRSRLARPVRARSWFSDRFLKQSLRFAHQPASFGRWFHSAQAQAIYLEARSKYHVHCMEWENKAAALFGQDAAFPFLDRDLISFLMAVPGDIQNRHGVPRAMLRAAMQHILPPSVAQRNWKADFTQLVNAGLERDYAHIAGTLTERSLAVGLGYLDRDRLRGELNEVMNQLRGPECVAGWELADLFALELWLQLFLSDDVREPREFHESQERIA
ncbi:MAG: hypothetical protein HY700_03255 [Gemmatimonadetes bacterium]|nr:hypothetical protein [Gemmatimonadota bacterium]